MDKETKINIIYLTLAYVGVGLQSWWGFWSNSVYGMPFTHIFEFIISFGGLL